MPNTTYSTGAIVFYSASRVVQADPLDVRILASSLGIPEKYVPDYAGDRETITRAKTACAAQLRSQGWMIDPIIQRKSEVAYGLVRATKNEDTLNLNYEHEATLAWKADAPDNFTCMSRAYSDAEAVGMSVIQEWRNRRGKIVAADWTQSICNFLTEECAAANVRDDGRVYWVPPMCLPFARAYSQVLDSVSIRLFVCEIEPERTKDMADIAEENIMQEVQRLSDEVSTFDGTQNAATYAARIDLIDSIERRAIAYRSALNVNTETCDRILDTLRTQLESLHAERTQKSVPRSTSTTTKPQAPQAACVIYDDEEGF